MKVVARYCVLTFTVVLFALTMLKAQGCHTQPRSKDTKAGPTANTSPRVPKTTHKKTTHKKTTQKKRAIDTQVDAGTQDGIKKPSRPTFMPARKMAPIPFPKEPPTLMPATKAGPIHFRDKPKVPTTPSKSTPQKNAPK